MESFARFTREITRVFGLSNEANIAIRVIQYLKQRKSAAEYSAMFQEYATQTDWDDVTLITIYRRGLKDNIKDELIRTGARLDDLDILIKESIEIDDKLFERQMEKKHDGGVRGFAGFESPRGHFQARDERRKQTSNPYGPMPMELNVFEKKGRNKGKKQYHKGKKALKYYSCGKPGHYARDCRSRGMMPSPQLNIMERTSSSEGEYNNLERLRKEDPKLDNLLTESDYLIGLINDYIDNLTFQEEIKETDDKEDQKELPN